MYVGLENGDAVEVIDTASNKVIAHVPVGQAPQALVYLSHVATGKDGNGNLVPRVNTDSVNIALRPTSGQGTGFVVVRHLGLADSIEAFLFKLKPLTAYDVYVGGQAAPVGSFKTGANGMANGTAIGPLREFGSSSSPTSPATVYVTESGKGGGIEAAVLRSD
jgi:YVTN family beta-propeller protein